jgi:hypothetical protein
MLICAFSFSAYAGNIECDVVGSLPPTTTEGDMHYPVTQIIVILIEDALSLP